MLGSPLASFAMQSSFADFRPWPRPFPNWPDPCMRRCGGLGVTKRGELRLLEPRIPGTGALFFCEQPPDAMATTLGKRVTARGARGKSPAIEGYGAAAK